MEEGYGMLVTVKDCMDFIEKIAPTQIASDWDSVGLQIGRENKEVKTLLVALTVTSDLVSYAISEQVDLLLVHHPLIFKALKALRTDTYEGRLIASLLGHDISVYVSHTNLDHAAEGLNHWLAEELELEDVSVICPIENSPHGLGRIGSRKPTSLSSLAQMLKEKWQVRPRILGKGDRVCTRIALCGGQGGSLLARSCALGADVFITGDMSYHTALEAEERGIALIDAGHFGTEQVMVSQVASLFEREYPRLRVIASRKGDSSFWSL